MTQNNPPKFYAYLWLSEVFVVESLPTPRLLKDEHGRHELDTEQEHATGETAELAIFHLLQFYWQRFMDKRSEFDELEGRLEVAGYSKKDAERNVNEILSWNEWSKNKQK